MMRTIEVLIVIIIITGAFIAASYFAVLPWPRQVSPMNLRRLSFTTLQLLDSDYALSDAAFQTDNATLWGGLQVALSASLPPNVIYNLTVYDVSQGATSQLYVPVASISNAESLGATSDASSYLVASSNVTFNVVPEKIGEHSGGGTLYILNCSDAPGWWITGYTAQSLAQDLYNLLSPYFANTIMVQNTTQLGTILGNTSLQGETVQNAVVINTCGEAVPMPSAYSSTGYYAPRDSYNLYFYILGQKTREYNWTWASIVGYPMYYVSNTGLFSTQNDWGVYGMKSVGPAGFNAFLRGLNQIAYNATWLDGATPRQAWWQDIYGNWIYDHGWITSELTSVPLSANAIYYSNYYGIYPASYQTATRALPTWITTTYNLTVTTSLFDAVNNYRAGAVYRNAVSGGFLALGLTRTPDIRLTALGLLADYKPRLYRSEYTANGTSRLVVLQLGLVGGV
ncbi:MAG: hypothetical protein NWE99_00695 [Candidatus Bathyarchaeota archaeon]|nr:hypothetical protein [Candidatus Bathyarchaeota archaeon]